MSLLIQGRKIEIEGVPVVTPDLDKRLLLRGRRNRTSRPRQITVHKTIADDPEDMIPGAGPSGGAIQTIEDWWNIGTVDGAHGVFDHDGTLYQLVDLYTVETFHATASNPWSIGFEMKEMPGGGFFETMMRNAVKIFLATCPLAGIQMQMQKRGTYTGHPLPRMAEHGPTPGGPDMVGIFGHRMNTERRGKWDPGEIVWDLLDEHGVHEFDYGKNEDLEFWKEIQSDLKSRGLLEYDGEPDGVAGPRTVAALKADGYVDGILALGKTS